ncbi:MAG: tRNA-(ms[2]io[6]A)-hydroxylase [Xanthomonadales bacterium]|nr:tRNA-(ms[2]io[6]A)-hydroxylase [Xanthomonadales bacterium]
MATTVRMQLELATSPAWTEAVLADFDRFLIDHAAAEKKASSMAMNMVAHYPDRPALVSAMIDLALEELTHFRAVARLIAARGLQLGGDEKDPYVNQFRRQIRHGRERYLLDQLLVGGIIEARGAERFGLIADALPAGDLKRFYRSITRSERNHQDLFVELACQVCDEAVVESRLGQLLAAEAAIVADLPIRAALH